MAIDNSKINICVTVNSKYERYLFIMLMSLYRENKKRGVNLFVIERDFTDADKEDIIGITQEYNNAVRFIHVDSEIFSGMPMSKKGRDNLSLEIYFRLLIPEFLPKEIERVLMLDVDIVVLHDLSDLYDIDFQGRYLAAAPNMCHNCTIPETWLAWYGENRNNRTHYNTGILLWNLKKIREDFEERYIFKQAWKHPIDVATFEEELFNVVFGESGIYELKPERFNYICTHEYEFETPNFYVYVSNAELKNKCSIVHYAALNPWQGGVKNEKFSLWWDVCKQTKYHHAILEECYKQDQYYLREYKKKRDDEIDSIKMDYERRVETEKGKLNIIGRLLDSETGKSISKKLQDIGINKIFLYGATNVARVLRKVLLEYNIETVCYIDKYYKGSFDGIRCYEVSSFLDIRSMASCMIITNSQFSDEIIADFSDISKLLIFTVEELIEKELFPDLLEWGGIINQVGCNNLKLISYDVIASLWFDILRNYGIMVSEVIKPEDIKSRKEEGLKYVLIDKKHIEIEKKLVDLGYRQNRDYIVVADSFERGYSYTTECMANKEFDRGSNNKNRDLSDLFCPMPFTQLYYYEQMSDICSPTWNNDVNTGNPQEMSIDEIWNSDMAKKYENQYWMEVTDIVMTKYAGE